MSNQTQYTNQETEFTTMLKVDKCPYLVLNKM